MDTLSETAWLDIYNIKANLSMTERTYAQGHQGSITQLAALSGGEHIICIKPQPYSMNDMDVKSRPFSHVPYSSTEGLGPEGTQN